MNRATIDLIKSFEGLRLKAYQDTGGVWTIGYGTTAMAGVGIVPKAGLTITEADAIEYLWRAVDKTAAQIRPLIKRPITENQFGAFVSLAYNIGVGAFGKSTALRKFNEGDLKAAADAILMWNKDDGKILPGLVRRRQAERALFLNAAAKKEEPMPGILKPLATSLIRHLATGIGGALVSYGVISTSEKEAVVGGIVALGGVAWSLIDKMRKA